MGLGHRVAADGGWDHDPSPFDIAGAVQFPVFLLLLACIWALDLFWAAMILRMIYKLLVLAELDDDRSDTEEEEGLRNRGKARTKQE